MAIKKSIVWKYFLKKKYGERVKVYCKFCNQSYFQNATRMERHILCCSKCPQSTKYEFVCAARNQKTKTIRDLKVTDNWFVPAVPKPQSIIFTEVNLPGWQYNDENFLIDNNVENEIEIEDSKDWNKNLLVPVQNKHSNNFVTQVPLVPINDNGSGNSIKTHADEKEVEKKEEVKEPESNCIKTHSSKKFPRRPSQTKYKAVNLLRTKIQHEQYLERQALRHIAELELQRKSLEFDRLKWEFHTQKTQSEIRWAHECRIMQLKEKHQKKLTNQKI